MYSLVMRCSAPLLVAFATVLTLSSALEAQEKRGYLGINLECEDCGRGERNGAVIWQFDSPPVITWIFEGGPAAKAGIREGDAIVAIDGVEITSEEGGRLFGSMRLGVPVEFRVQREDGEATVVVTPGSGSEAFGEEYAAVMYTPGWDSMKVQLKYLYEGLPKLQVALRQAERALEVDEAEAQRSASELQQRVAEIQRTQIDSINRQLAEWQKQIRVYTDSLAARTLYVMPRSVPEVRVDVAPTVEAKTITIYSDAVAGARFKELGADSPMLEYFPGVSSGLLIHKVVEGTPAHTAGLQEGDVVVAVNSQPVQTVAGLRKMFRGTDEAKLTFVRKGKEHSCTITSKKKEE